MPTKQTDGTSARARLLAAAGELFYEEGVHTVGIDRVIERAGVAKATLYSAFGCKDELIRAYLKARHAATQERMMRGLVRFDTPRDRLIGVFEVQSLSFTDPGFRGCAFVGASAEASSGTAVQEATADYRAWVQSLFRDLAVEAGVADPATLARQLVILYDGAGISAWIDRDPTAAIASVSLATAVVDAAIAAGRSAGQRS
ncbi:MAG TPA: TetR/AcrR family transcriptional regulator [Pseudonocardiaceae bacterium]|jgi:AcrR family transcriptional regulator|nr:TetR/AcrR family transcriptional regulator [Pseudonocardiaceae bacterium]